MERVELLAWQHQDTLWWWANETKSPGWAVRCTAEGSGGAEKKHVYINRTKFQCYSRRKEYTHHVYNGTKHCMNRQEVALLRQRKDRVGRGKQRDLLQIMVVTHKYTFQCVVCAGRLTHTHIRKQIPPPSSKLGHKQTPHSQGSLLYCSYNRVALWPPQHLWWNSRPGVQTAAEEGGRRPGWGADWSAG